MSESGKSSTDGYMRGVRDANSFEKNKFLKKQPHALRLQLWSDDVEFVNPLGSKTKKNWSIASFAYSILNLTPYQNSLLSNIFLYAVVKTSDIKAFGFAPVFSKFIKEIDILESEAGMELKLIDGGRLNVQK